jgi:hypothetical protein
MLWEEKHEFPEFELSTNKESFKALRDRLKLKSIPRAPIKESSEALIEIFCDIQFTKAKNDSATRNYRHLSFHCPEPTSAATKSSHSSRLFHLAVTSIIAFAQKKSTGLKEKIEIEFFFSFPGRYDDFLFTH